MVIASLSITPVSSPVAFTVLFTSTTPYWIPLLVSIV